MPKSLQNCNVHLFHTPGQAPVPPRFIGGIMIIITVSIIIIITIVIIHQHHMAAVLLN